MLPSTVISSTQESAYLYNVGGGRIYYGLPDKRHESGWHEFARIEKSQSHHHSQSSGGACMTRRFKENTKQNHVLLKPSDLLT